jgi:hypothetical protein
MHENLRFSITKDGHFVADQILPTQREGWMTFEAQQAIPLSFPVPPVFPVNLSFEIFDADHRLLFSGKGPVFEKIVTIIGLGDGHANADESVVKLQLRMLDPRVVDKWQRRGGWNDKYKTMYATILGHAFASLLLEATNQEGLAAPATAQDSVPEGM